MESRERRASMPETDGLWIVVPAHNEESVIGSTLAGLREFMPRVIVVDDGSSDRTGAIARRRGATVLRHVANLGQGAALQTGIDAALMWGARLICTFDADGQHDPAVIARMLDAQHGARCDVVLASRFLEGDTKGIPPLRRFVLRAALLFTRWQTGLRITDTHNGLRLLTRTAAQRMRIHQNGMAHASEILSHVAERKLHYTEVPAAVSYTRYSLSKGQSAFDSVKILFDIVYAAWSR
jgi:glycosyltransferase involved in cell wall biosynthesis